ncbi:MAG: Tat pathway signal sequence domain protein [Rhodospirillales bacterium]
MRHCIQSTFAAAVLAVGFCLSADPASAAVKGRIGVELNKLEPAGDACRAYLLLSNGTAMAFTSLKLDLVTFDGDGIVQRRVAVEAAPIGAGKTSLKVFDISGTKCSGIGRMLLNGVMSCKGDKAQTADCLALVSVSSRAAQPFIK